MGIAPDSDSERVLSQALRAAAGGHPGPVAGQVGPPAAVEVEMSSRLTPLQVLLIAAIIGVAIGAGAGLVVLLTG